MAHGTPGSGGKGAWLHDRRCDFLCHAPYAEHPFPGRRPDRHERRRLPPTEPLPRIRPDCPDPRRGDRSLRDEDRYLFLESILSARDCFYISYVGQSIKDNSEIPPSVLVSELIDAIDRVFTVGKDITIEDHLVTRHRLQAFSRDYFTDGSPLFSYSAENCAALNEKRSGPKELRSF